MNGQRREDMVTVAIDKDKGSQYALKWAVDHLLGKGKIVTLLHVKQRPSSIPTSMGNHVALSDVSDEVAKAYKDQVDNQAKELFLPFRCFCTRKDIQVNEVLLEDMDVAKAICEYVKVSLIENLVVGATSRNGFVRTFKTIDVPGSISKGAPEFCTVHVISKGKIASVRSASIPVPNQPTVGLLQKQLNPIPSQTDVGLMQGNTARGLLLLSFQQTSFHLWICIIAKKSFSDPISAAGAPERAPLAYRNLNDDMEIK
ncbi:unnamed protein product [Ilex paraguariensis]|uniref:RING-type E3 ubiquitin transferase n=1 Tax=Ilex paraguariensis TaxID=185542 RepID=A0ABC8TCU3_9AQUA